MTGAPNHDPIDGKRIDHPDLYDEAIATRQAGAHVGPSGLAWSTKEVRRRDVEIVSAFLRKRGEDAERWLEDMHAHGMNPDAIDRAEARAMDCAEAIGAFKRIVGES